MPEHHFESDFSIVQTTYAVAMTLGLERIAESVFQTFVAHSYAEAGYTGLMLIKGVLSAALALLGIRFMSAPRNIRRFVLAHAHDGEEMRRRKVRTVTTVHLPVLLLHALLFFVLCQMVLEMKSVQEAWHEMPRMVWLYGGLLALNAAWLMFLVSGREEREPENVWIWNNGLFAVTMVLTLLVWRFFAYPQWALFAVIACLLFLNSFIDLSRTAESYLSKWVPGGSQD